MDSKLTRILVVLCLWNSVHSKVLKKQPTGWHYFHTTLDQDKDGRISKLDMLHLIDDYTSSQIPTARNLDAANEAILKFDLDNSGYIEWKEFKSVIGDPIESSPQQVHIALTTTPTEVVIMWVTAYQNPSIVNIGTTPGNYPLSFNGTEATYDVGLDGWDGWVHKVNVTGLKPSTIYYYQVGSTDSGFSNQFQFQTAPSQPIKDSTTQIFAVVGDMGTYIPMGWAVIDQLVNDNALYNFSMVLHAGDVCYAGTGSDWEIEEVWDVWGNLVQPVSAVTPYMFSVGNHEHYYNYTSYLTRFQMPSEQSGGYKNFWYSFDYGNVHFCMMSTEHDYTGGSIQYNWIEQDLAAARKNLNIKWIIVSGHRPMYSSDQAEWDAHKPGAPFQMIIEPLFVKYGVDLYLCGHMHTYERVYPVIDGNVTATGNVYTNPHATAHVVQGTAGVFTDDKWEEDIPSWSATRSDHWGYGKMTTNATHLHYEFMIQESYSVFDEFWIIKSP